jgi:hypothetical protein
LRCRNVRSKSKSRGASLKKLEKTWLARVTVVTSPTEIEIATEIEIVIAEPIVIVIARESAIATAIDATGIVTGVEKETAIVTAIDVTDQRIWKDCQLKIGNEKRPL